MESIKMRATMIINFYSKKLFKTKFENDDDGDDFVFVQPFFSPS